MLSCDVEAAMQFLNDAASQYPQAISLAAGRPPNQFLLSSRVPGWIERFVQRQAHAPSEGAAVWQSLGQYSRTQGIINTELAEFINREEELGIDESQVLVSNGFQEALTVALLGLIDRSRDVVLAVNPTYPGLSGILNALNMTAMAIEPPLPDAVRAACRSARQAGRRAKALYVVPDFSNPTGETLPIDVRVELLEACAEEGVTILEDTAYRCFSYGGCAQPPTLAKLTKAAEVFTLGSFSKTLMPGLRLGYVAGPAEGVARMTLLKSFVSVATSPILQAALVGYLKEFDEWADVRHARRDWCHRNLKRLVMQLEEEFGKGSPLEGRVRWTQPNGGFFVAVDLPFEFGAREMREAAAEYGVLVCPMSMFSLDGSGKKRIRLAFANVTEDEVGQAVQRLATYVRKKAAETDGKAAADGRMSGRARGRPRDAKGIAAR